MNKPLKLIGIVTVGVTRQEAMDRYKSVSSGQGACAMRDEGGTLALVTHGASLSAVFNPVSGDMDLVEDASLLNSVTFNSESSVEGKDVFHVHCSDGCGAHIVADTPIAYCLACTASLSSDEETDDMGEEDETEETYAEDESDEVDTDEVDDEDSSEPAEVAPVAAEVKPETVEVLSADVDEDEAAKDEVENDAQPEEDSEDEVEDDMGDEDLGEDDDLSDDEDEPIAAVSSSFTEAIQMFASESASISKLSSVSSDQTQSMAHASVCTSAACGVKIVSDIPMHACPMCSASTQDPEGKDLEELNGSVDLPESAVGLGLSDAEGNMDLGEDEDMDELDLEDQEPEDLELDTPEAAVVESSDEPMDEDSMLEFDATETLPEDAPSEGLDVMYGKCSGEAVWIAVYDGVPVARAMKSKCSAEHAPLFDTATFGKATLAGAKHGSVKTSLTQMGFEPITHQVSVSNVVAKCIEEGIEDKVQAMESERENFRKDFTQCLATASAGMSRGFFQGMQNPLKSVLCESLSAAGMANAETFVDNAFAKAADAYHAGLIDKAVEIFAKPAEVRDSLSQTIMSVSHVSTSSTGSQSNLGDRLASMGSVVQAAPKEDSGRIESKSSGVSADFMSDLNAVIGQLGRRRS